MRGVVAKGTVHVNVHATTRLGSRPCKKKGRKQSKNERVGVRKARAERLEQRKDTPVAASLRLLERRERTATGRKEA